MTDLLDQGAAAIASAIRAGRTSARDVAETAMVGRKTSAGAIPSPFGFAGASGLLYGVTVPTAQRAEGALA